MKKKSYVIFIALLLLLIFAGCNNEIPDPDTEPDLSDPKIEAFPNVVVDNTAYEAGYNTIKGIVKDENHNLLTNIDLFFGEDNAFVKKTDEAGEFAFCFKDPHSYEGAQQADYLSLDSEIYSFKVFVKCVLIHNGYNNIDCLVIAVEKEKDVNFTHLIMALDDEGNFTNISLDVKFDQDGVLLPPGYVSRNTVYETGGESTNGETSLVGVEVFLNGGSVPLAVSDPYSTSFEYLFIGDRLTFVKDGFAFHTKQPGESGFVSVPLEDDTFIITGPVPQGYEIRGNCGDNFDILM